jgi:hypothetical protein
VSEELAAEGIRVPPRTLDEWAHPRKR